LSSEWKISPRPLLRNLKISINDLEATRVYNRITADQVRESYNEFQQILESKRNQFAYRIKSIDAFLDKKLT
jgi:hypothetical protein